MKPGPWLWTWSLGLKNLFVGDLCFFDASRVRFSMGFPCIITISL